MLESGSYFSCPMLEESKTRLVDWSEIVQSYRTLLHEQRGYILTTVIESSEIFSEAFDEFYKVLPGSSSQESQKPLKWTTHDATDILSNR